MSDHSIPIQGHVHPHDRTPAPLGLGWRQLGIGSALLAALVFAPSPAAAAANSPIVIDFDQGRLILGWASLWVVAVVALLACDVGGRTMTRQFAQAVSGRVRHKLMLWRKLAKPGRSNRGTAQAAQLQATAGRISASQMAAVLAESRARQCDRVSQVVFPATDRHVGGRTFSSTPMTGLPTHHRTVPA